MGIDRKEVRLTKISATKNWVYPTPGSLEEYESNKYRGKYSLPIGYIIEGIFLSEPRVGESIRLQRTDVGDNVSRVFTTSPVKEFTLTEITTTNSVYRVEKIIS